jgi:hypothetical protein
MGGPFRSPQPSGECALNSTWDWQFFLKDTGDGRTYFEWLISAWGWTLSVAVLALIVRSPSAR